MSGGGVLPRLLQVVVWDTSRDEPLLATTKIDDLYHREPVTSVRGGDETSQCALRSGCA